MVTEKMSIIDAATTVPDEGPTHVRVPYYPKHGELRLLMPIWAGRTPGQITGLRGAIQKLRGTLQNPVDWSKPDEWISERLDGQSRELAAAIWEGTRKKVTPRHVQGHWLLSRRYGLLEPDSDGLLRLTDQGQSFLTEQNGKAEALIDRREGLTKILSIVADNGPARFGRYVDPWADFLQGRSNFRTDSTIKDTLRRRLTNLLDRGLLDRSSQSYSVTDAGLSYLARVGDVDTAGPDEAQRIRRLLKQHTTSVRESLHKVLSSMDPFGFEHLVKHLLEGMDYENVEVTSPANDGGVDVVADIQLGITSVREVVQAKRHKKNIQRPVLDALRGSLHRFDAVRGTIIATSKFSKGTQSAAFERGAAPITLIDGEKLIDLLIENGIGVKKKTIEVLELDADAFVFGGETEDEEG